MVKTCYERFCPKREDKNKKNGKEKADGFNKDETKWLYSEKVKNHFFYPRNIFRNDDELKGFDADGIGLVGSPACGDGMKMFIKVEKRNGKNGKENSKGENKEENSKGKNKEKNNKDENKEENSKGKNKEENNKDENKEENKDGKEIIADVKWQTFGCATAISSTSIFSEMIKGKTIEEALKITPKDIADALGGLPARKFHCSVLADQAFKAAVEDYRKKKK